MRDLQDRYTINSISRASSILKCFLGDKTHFKLSEIADRLDLDRSTTYRLLISLEKCGFVEKDIRTREYSLGLSAFEIGFAYLKQMDFMKVSKPIMMELAEKAQETVHLAVMVDTEIIYVDKVDSPRAVGVLSKIGQRGPVYCTALGKVMLAFQTEEEKKRIMTKLRFKTFTANTITNKKKLAEELESIKKQGYALDRREIEDDVECIGAPIKNHLGQVIAALSVSGPKYKIGTPLEEQFISGVRDAAETISMKLGFLKEKSKD